MQYSCCIIMKPFDVFNMRCQKRHISLHLYTPLNSSSKTPLKFVQSLSLYTCQYYRNLLLNYHEEKVLTLAIFPLYHYEAISCFKHEVAKTPHFPTLVYPVEFKFQIHFETCSISKLLYMTILEAYC